MQRYLSEHIRTLYFLSKYDLAIQERTQNVVVTIRSFDKYLFPTYIVPLFQVPGIYQWTRTATESPVLIKFKFWMKKLVYRKPKTINMKYATCVGANWKLVFVGFFFLPTLSNALISRHWQQRNALPG